MISLPSDFIAAPTVPTSGIAPKELIGNANFPQLLGGFQTGAPGGQKASAQQTVGRENGLGNGADNDAGVGAQEAGADLTALAPLSGNPLPQSGTRLPLNQTLVPSDGAGLGVATGENWSGANQGLAGLNSLRAVPVEGEVGDVVVDDADGQAPLDRAFSPVRDSFDKTIGSPGGDLGLQPSAKPKLEELARNEGGPANLRATADGAEIKAPRVQPQTAAVNTAAAPAVLSVSAPALLAAIPLETANETPLTDKQTNAPAQAAAGPGEVQANAGNPQPEGRSPEKSAPEPQLKNPTPAAIEARGGDARQAMRARDALPNAASIGVTERARPQEISPDGEVKLAKVPNEPAQPAVIPNAAAQTNEQSATAQVRADQRGVRAPNMMSSARGKGTALRAQSDIATTRARTDVNQGGDLKPVAGANAVQRAVIDMGDVDVDPDLPKAPLPAAGTNAPLGSNQSPAQQQALPLAQGPSGTPELQTPELQTPAAQTQVAAAPAASQTMTPTPIVDTGAGARLAPQLENAIEQLAETRSAAQANKPELTVRHQEFGAVTMRLETTAGDLRATLSARDPGFVPAIQAALAERSVAASSETASGNTSKGNDQSGSNANSQGQYPSGNSGGSHSQSHGQGWGFGGAYGSSTGSGQGTSQPYSGQTEGRDDNSGSDQAGRGPGGSNGSDGDGEIFA